MVRGVRLWLCVAGIWAAGCGNGNGGDGDDTDCGALTDCDGVCVDTRTDTRNCGACGSVCPVGFACIDGACDDRCPAGLTLCVDDTPSCEDLSSSGGNCGACNNECPSGTSCRSGVCVSDDGDDDGVDTCPPGLTLCVDDTPSCEDLSSSGGNCGACNNRCPSGTSCRSGVCVGSDVRDDDDDDGNGGMTCPPGLTLCVDDTPSCEDLSSSGGNCGACNNRCPSGTSCEGGVCVGDDDDDDDDRDDDDDDRDDDDRDDRDD